MPIQTTLKIQQDNMGKTPKANDGHDINRTTGYISDRRMAAGSGP
jgi:hypothetical protein